MPFVAAETNNAKVILVDGDGNPVSPGGGGSGGDVTVTSSVLPTGAATEISLASINGKTPALVGGAVPVAGPLTDAQLRATEIPVSAASLPLPTGAASETTLNVINTKTPMLGPADAAVSTPSVLANKLTFAGVQYVAGSAVLNIDLLTGAVNGWLNVSTYNSAVVTITAGAGITAGVIQFEETNDTTISPNGTLVLGYNTTTQSANPISSVTLAASQTSSVYLPLRAKFFRCRVSTAVAGGTVQAVITQSQIPYAPTNTTVNQATAASLQATIAAIPAGANAIGDVGVQARANATGAASGSHLISANGTNAAVIKSSAGRVLGWHFANKSAAWAYVKLHNQTTTPTAGTGVVRTIAIPPGGVSAMDLPVGIAFATGIGRTTTSGAADSDATAVAADDIVGDIFFA